MTKEIKKPECKLIGEDSNIFNLLARASRTLKENDMQKEADEMRDRAKSAKSYDEALCIIGEHVIIR